MSSKFLYPDPGLQLLQQNLQQNIMVKQKFGARLRSILKETEARLPNTTVPTILLIEDDDVLCRSYERLLQHRAQILVAHSPQEALGILAEQMPDLIVSDSIGIPVIEEKFQAGFKAPPVLFVSGHSLPPDLPRQLGIDGYVIDKPVDAETLRAKVEELMAKQCVADE